MKRQPALYTLKVWLSSAIVSPLIAAALKFYCYNANTFKIDWLMFYPAIVLFEIVVTSLLWILFWASAATWSNMVKDDTAFRCAASCTGLAIAAVLCWLMTKGDHISLDNLFFTVSLANCFCIFAGCWYFDIGRSVTTALPTTITTEKHEQTPE